MNRLDVRRSNASSSDDVIESLGGTFMCLNLRSSRNISDRGIAVRYEYSSKLAVNTNASIILR